MLDNDAGWAATEPGWTWLEVAGAVIGDYVGADRREELVGALERDVDATGRRPRSAAEVREWVDRYERGEA